VTPWFPVKRSTRAFQEISIRTLERHRAEAVAGPATALRYLAEQALADGAALPSLKYGVIALAGIGHPPLSAEDRDLLWSAFHVPVFEQFRGLRGELLASECHAHQGMHVHTGEAVFEGADGGLRELLLTSPRDGNHAPLKLATGLEAAIDDSPCACGETSPRLVGLQCKSVPLARGAAACA
jgi:phenylacetate-coenzyme A ligase PaaK-like adenylate-forming protein